MKLGLTLLAAGAALFVSTQANAAGVLGQISINGYANPVGSTGMAGATGIDFVSGQGGSASPGVAGTLTSFGAGTGSFAGLSCSTGSCGTIMDIGSFALFSGQNGFFTLTTGLGGPTISFDLTAITDITRLTGANALVLTGNGFFNFSGLDRTAGTFSLTAQGNSITSFSASVAAVPEPATWGMMLLGFGMVGGAMRYRRRTTKVAFAA